MRDMDGALLEGTLRDGTPVYVRPLLHSDRETFAKWFTGLSDRTKRSRFLQGKGRKLSETSLDQLVDAVDQHDHVAVAVIAPDVAGAGEEYVGGGRFVRMSDDPSTAEVAVTIADSYQGLGAGSLVMRALTQRAREEGVRTFMATMLEENEASRRMMSHAGTVVRDDVSDGVREYAVRID